MKIKMCGLRRTEDIIYANECIPDYIGFVFAESKRKVSAEKAAKLGKELNPSIKKVGVFVNEPVRDLILAAEQSGIDIIQLHGDEDREYINEVKQGTEKEIWKAVRVKTAEDIEKTLKLPADKLLLDSFSENSYGGTGKVMDFDVLRQIKIPKPYFIAGGLTIENLPGILEGLEPYGIDISSGIESGGVKDRDKMMRVTQCVRGGNNE
ncbi:phosphoribosylanthranilate isomerase [Anaerostipes sp.]|uniref:phosphoribosylanthranilate isomerase n=1 Tax=Anaerostipes sp. TaxID=1872530 RepID=UPI0025C63224|nr:phosphoribosylanthranilate isomerase [Anaerostipes sp.]MBS7007174.1 phosphoribosylanthranilate isomerase [Anaerostipes sp.]